MKVKFYLERKVSKTGNSTLWCYVREYKETIYLNTKQKIKPELWDPDSQRANLRKTRDILTKKSLKDLNQFLDKFEYKIYEIEREIRNKDAGAGFSLIADSIKQHFNKRKVGFFDIYNEFLILQQKKVSKQTYLKYKHAKELLEEYQKIKKEQLNFDKITPLLFSKYFSFLIDIKKMINNTANKNIKFLKTFIIWANDNNYTNNKSYRKYKLSWEEIEVIYLTEGELNKLNNVKLDEERHKRVRDMFIFQCHTGVRYSDIENISIEDIKGSTWEFTSKKTHQNLNVPLSSQALLILEKYREYPQPLPVISNQKMNEYLKELCEKAEINDPIKTIRHKGSERIETTFKKFKLISTHTARRTFVSLSLQRGMKAETIMKITGHKTYSMMQRYLNIADTHTRDEMDKAWGSPLRVVK